MNDLFEGYNIERSDNVDIGMRFRKDFIEVNPTIFLSKHKNLLTTITDTRVTDTSTGKPVNYQQNIGKAKGYGFELGTNVFISDWLTFYVNTIYNPKIAIRKRRFFSYPVILRGLMPRSAVLSKALSRSEALSLCEGSAKRQRRGRVSSFFCHSEG